MPEINLTAETRTETGSGPARRLRTEGKIPAVVYGHGIDPLSVAVDGRELRAALTTESGTNALINLSVGSDSLLTLARVLQRDPVRHTVTHIDFQVVSRDELITADVGIVLTGEAKTLTNAGGVVDQQAFTLTIEAVPANIPHSIEVDITDLEVGGVVRVGDLVLPDGVSAIADPEDPIVAGAIPQTEDLDAAAAEAAGEVAPEGGEAEAADGEQGGDASEGGDVPAESEG